QELLPSTPIEGEIAPRGDYHVFRTGPAARGSLEAEVKIPANSKLKPVILVFDGSGDKLRAAVISSGKSKAWKLRRPAAGPRRLQALLLPLEITAARSLSPLASHTRITGLGFLVGGVFTSRSNGA